MQKLNVKSFAFALGVSWGLYMLIIGWLAPFGWGGGFIKSISSLYIGFQPGFAGGIIGGVWGFVDGLIGGAIIAFIYNLCVRKNSQ